MSRTLTQTPAEPRTFPSSAPTNTLKLRPSSDRPEYLDDLATKGYAVVKDAVSAENAARYCDKAWEWLESFGKGFDRNDRSTWHVDRLPPHAKGGMYRLAGVGHEQFCWDIRSELGVIDVFANVWGTEKLVVSFDAINMALPLPDEQTKDKIPPWPHVDQSPLKRGLHCIQGIVNLGDNGPEDGGLMVLEGSMPLYSEFFDWQPHSGLPQELNPYPQKDLYLHSDAELKWFLDRGCKWVKVCCEPGDVIIWDSRCIHYGSLPKSETPRLATYVCYKPVDTVSDEDMAKKKKAMEELVMTTHEPSMSHLLIHLPEWDGYRDVPLARPVLSERALQLAGLKPY